MFGIIKDVIDVLFILFVFYAGMKVQQNYPNLITDIKGFFSGLGSIYTWLKGLASKL
jgi:hypothetical protein